MRNLYLFQKTSIFDQKFVCEGCPDTDSPYTGLYVGH